MEGKKERWRAEKDMNRGRAGGWVIERHEQGEMEGQEQERRRGGMRKRHAGSEEEEDERGFMLGE